MLVRQRLRPSSILLRCLSVLCLLAHLCAGGFIGIDDSTWETIRRQGCNVGCYSLGKLLIPMCRAFCNNDGKIDEDQVRLAADADTPKDPSPFRRRQFNDAPITSDQAGTPENIEGPPMARCNTYLPQNPDNANFKVGQTGRLQQRQLQVNPNNPGFPLDQVVGTAFAQTRSQNLLKKALRRREVVKTLSDLKSE
ncbi:hypothetical protein BC829DRAFT_444007 [Chytridium lagenaria]|nr:hypothetical protein BC829DRAFT_444007 [Chytridium lagenaria]